MKKLYVAGNWKLNKTVVESLDWLTKIGPQIPLLESVEVIVCPSFLSLMPMKALIDKNQWPIKLGAQTVSSYPAGKYTGEVGAFQLAGQADYAIVGHSERQKHFHESVSDIEAKVEALLENSITPIICISDLVQLREFKLEMLVGLVAFEPPSAISAGLGGADQSLEPAEINDKCAELLKYLKPQTPLLYGGSVMPDNAHDIFSQPSVSGGLIGGASLDPDPFLELIQIASKVGA